jgi:hypothetical protein
MNVGAVAAGSPSSRSVAAACSPCKKGCDKQCTPLLARPPNAPSSLARFAGGDVNEVYLSPCIEGGAGLPLALLLLLPAFIVTLLCALVKMSCSCRSWSQATRHRDRGGGGQELRWFVHYHMLTARKHKNAARLRTYLCSFAYEIIQAVHTRRAHLSLQDRFYS